MKIIALLMLTCACVAAAPKAVSSVSLVESIPVENEKYKLSIEPLNRWAGGTHLKGCTGTTPLPGCLVPGSMVVKLADGTILEPDKDYRFDEKWAGLSRIEGGRIAADTEVLISYRIGQMRIDTIQITPAGEVSIVRGTPAKMAPLPPTLAAGNIAVANVFIPYNATSIEPSQIYPVGPAYPEPDAAEITRRAALVPKTLAKLRAGEPITLVTWGDSVTSGGESSTPDKAFAPLFAARLGARFPKSKINFVNAGIGGTSTPGRLPAIQKEVLDHHPDLVTIEFVNDMGLPEKAVRDNYASAFKQIRDAGGEILLLTPHFTMPEMMGRESIRGPESRDTVAQLRAIAAEHHVGLADAAKRWEHLEVEGIPYTTLLVNGINHPDDRGHEMFVKELMTFFPEK